METQGICMLGAHTIITYLNLGAKACKARGRNTSLTSRRPVRADDSGGRAEQRAQRHATAGRTDGGGLAEARDEGEHGFGIREVTRQSLLVTIQNEKKIQLK